MIIPFLGSGCPAGLRKMDWSLLLSFCCHLSIGRKTECALHCRVFHWYLPSLFPKQNLTDSSRYSRGMESVIILFLLTYFLKKRIVSSAELRDSLKSWYFLLWAGQLLKGRMCVDHVPLLSAPNRGSLNLTSSLCLQQTVEVQEENAAPGQRKLAAGNQIWLQFQQAQRRSYECWVPIKGQQCRFYLSRIWI